MYFVKVYCPVQVQTIDRDCDTVGCDIESTCSFLLDCFADAFEEEPTDVTFPVSSEDPRAAEAAYQCLKAFSAAVRNTGGSGGSGGNSTTGGTGSAQQEQQTNTTAVPSYQVEAEEEDEEWRRQRELMIFTSEDFAPSNDLGPRVYQSSTLTYRMFGFRGPLWMTQTCNSGSGCPFVQGPTGGGTRTAFLSTL